jgi:hypothetical protein
MTHDITVLELVACTALLLSAAVFVRNAWLLTTALHGCQLRREHKNNEHHLAQFRKRLAALEGRANQSHIQAKVAQRYSQLAHDAAIDSKTRVGALEKSTHKVHFMPVDKLLERNGAATDAMDSVLNPSAEKFDWFGEDLDD